jgi:selenium-binding protein 1
MQKGPREKLLYIPALYTNKELPNYLATVDIDASSKTYLQVIARLELPGHDDEIHHSGYSIPDCSLLFEQLMSSGP